MYEDLPAKMAKVITEYSQPVNEGDLVVIQASSEAIPLVHSLFEAILARGGNPIVVGGVPGLGERFLQLANEDQLQFVSPIAKWMFAEADIIINMMAGANTKAFTRVDPQRLALSQKANAEIYGKFFERLGDGSLRWVLVPYPTQADAQEAEMGLLDWTKFIYEACKLHLDDPIGYWHGVRDEQTRLTEWLADKHEAHIKGPGIDLKFNFEDRVWVSAHGNLNFPDGEIYTGPIEDSVNGYVNFNMRTIYGGHEVDGVRFRYEDGVIVDASADKGEEFLISNLDMDEGARRLGEFAIGTNWDIQEVTGNTLYDEKIGGTIHMAIGRSIPETKGENISTVHWDMVHDMKDGGEIYIDGELFYQSGKFMV